jgi:hypothetical protein
MQLHSPFVQVNLLFPQVQEEVLFVQEDADV